MSIILPALPYHYDALEPYISARTLEFHHDKHHNAYVVNANKLISSTKFEKMEIEEIIKETAGHNESVAIFNNVAQCWNHSFYWLCMHPKGGGKPKGPVKEKIEESFGDFEKFVDAFKKAGATQFGSGWAWCIIDAGKLQIIKTANADTPLAHHQKAILTVDVWEHAYYLDYQNRRPDYLNIFMEKLVNWEFVNSQLK